MSDQARYVYSTVRVVPDPATGEFANLAAIAGSDETGEWALRGIQNERRALRFCGHDALVAAHDFMARVGMSIDLADWTLDEDFDSDLETLDDSQVAVSEDWLRGIALSSQHVVQLSDPRPIMAESVDDALDAIFPHLFREPERRRRTLTKWALVSNMNYQYLMAGLDSHRQFERRVSLIAAGPRNYRHSLDFVVRSSQVVQIVQTWSFQVDNQLALSRDVKAWGWTVRELQNHGGTVHMAGRNVHVPSDVPVDVILAAPDVGDPTDRYDEALSVFHDVGASVHQHGQEEAVATEAVSLLGGLD